MSVAALDKRRAAECGQWPNVLVPWDVDDTADLKLAARIAKRSVSTIRNWCEVHGIGRLVVGKHSVSIAALLMLLEENTGALKAYHAGDRSSPLVKTYFERARAIIIDQNSQNIAARAKAPNPALSNSS